MKYLNKIVNQVLGFLEGPVTAVLFAIVTIIVFIQVVFRVVGASLPWSEELARYINTWTIFFGASICVRESKHLAVDLMPFLLKGNKTALIIQQVVVDLASLLFFVYVAYYGAKVLGNLTTFPQKSAALSLNMIWCYAAPFVGMVMMSIRTIQKMVEHITGKTVADKFRLKSAKPAEGGAE